VSPCTKGGSLGSAMQHVDMTCALPPPSSGLGRGLHSSTSQLNLSRF